MANPGAGTKFVSVNLNRSYGQPSSSSSNAGGGGRLRPSSHGSSIGGGMVVLSRPRSSVMGPQKIGPKLSVPPPLNLPSLKREHERFDSSATGIGSARPGSSGTGSRPTSSGMGWTKPVHSTLQDKDGGAHHPLVGRSVSGAQVVDGGDHPLNSADAPSKSSSVYMPPSARSGTVSTPVISPAASCHPVEKAVVLRGEDFPSLRATLPTALGSAQKQKETLHQKQKQKTIDEATDEQTKGSGSGQLLHMRPQVQSSRHDVGFISNENGGVNRGSGDSSRREQSRKLDDFFPVPLPLVRLNHTSDWEDDERDTGHGLPNRSKDHGLSRNEAFFDREFDRPRVGGLPRSHGFDLPDSRVLRADDVGKVSSKEFPSVDSYGRDFRPPSREFQDGNTYRSSSLAKDEYKVREVGIDRNGGSAKPFTLNRDMNGDGKYNQPPFGDNYRDFSNGSSGTQDSRFGRRDSGYGQGNRLNANQTVESFANRGTEQNMRDRHGVDTSNRYRGDFFQNSSVAKASFASGRKGLLVNDPLLDFGREKRSFSKNRKTSNEDFVPGLGFDARDSFSGGLVGVFKKKKDVLKQTDFHDPVRESFEAELERVQKMQEQERQRIIVEQARALELARKEEEERERLAREEEERQRRLEEEAREAAWRAEQERLEAARRADEQRMAREEEKRRILMEEERRKEAARQKLKELEDRMARRQAEGLKDDKHPAVGAGIVPKMPKEKDVSREAEVGGWEDGERMVERITNSASSDSSTLNRSFEMGSRPHSSRDGNSPFLDRVKPVNSWRRDVFENSNSSSFLPQDPENGYCSPKRDTFGAGRAFPRKDVYGGSGVVSARTASKGVAEAYVVDDFPHLRSQKWNLHGDGDHFGRNSEVDADFTGNSADNGFGVMGWGQARSRINPHAAYPDGLYQNFEADGYSSYGRSRHSMRQPRVLPPPSIASSQKISYRAEPEWSKSSTFVDSEMRYQHVPHRSEPMISTGYDVGYQERPEQLGIMEAQQENAVPENKLDKPTTPGCDSQSSLSVSSPPDSPIHLSHDDLDESRYSPALPAATEGKEMALSDSEHIASAPEMGNAIAMTASNSIAPLEDEEWDIENNEELQEQEEYDEEEDGFQEEDEVHEADDSNVDLSREFQDLHVEENDASDEMSQLVLGFNEGVEVEIPSGDKFERITKDGENAVWIEHESIGIKEEPGSFDGLADGPGLQSENYSSSIHVGSSSETIQETERALQDLVIQPVDADHNRTTSSGFLLHTAEASSSPYIPIQQPVVSSSNMTLPSSVQPVESTVSSVPSEADGPIKLQFGLFSGPSLIPPPVPAIQIGSIQMPLHLHPQVGPSLSQIHPSQPTFFQFGQLRYPSPVAQGILPLTPQSMSFVQPTISGRYTLNQNQGSPHNNQAGLDSSGQMATVKDSVSFVLMDNQLGFVPKPLDVSQENAGKEENLPARESLANEVPTYQSQAESSIISELQPEGDPVSLDQQNHHLTVKKNNTSISNNGESQGQLQSASNLSQFHSSDRVVSRSKAPVQMSGGKGKKFIYTVKNSGSRSSILVPESSVNFDMNGFQRKSQRNIRRTEFRVRENGDRRQMETAAINGGQDGKLNYPGKVSGISSRSGARRDAALARPSKQSVQSETVQSGLISSRMPDSDSKVEKGQGKEASKSRVTSSRGILRSGEGNLKRNINEADVDSPLQSGFVRVFKQPGIEAASDEDDFIEVRSKRQMLNDRREQKQKEIKAKSRAHRRLRSSSQNAVTSNNSIKIATSSGEAASNSRSESVVADGRALPSVVETPAGLTSAVALQPLPPIGTPAVNANAHTDNRSHNIKSLQANPVPAISSGGTSLGLGLPFENKNVVRDNVQTSLIPWGNARISQQVMALTQTQLDEAMNPSRFDARVASIGDHSGTVIMSSKPSTTIMTQDKSYSAGSPLNSLLAGEKIQFGAVTSPTVLPPGSRAMSNGIISSGACRSDPIDHNLSAAQNDCALFFEKEKQPDESCIHLEDPEAEAEAAASAVAVAAISNDEIAGNDLVAGSVSVSDAKSFGGAETAVLAAGKGVTGDQQSAGQSRGEESLSVSLPADLSVETPSLSLWPPLPSPQNSSTQMLPRFPGAPPSHFPCYEINPMLGGPIFAFGPHDESAGTQSQNSSTPASGTLGGWQQCHSGLDSFYGTPAGFTGPFISPPGGIPGVQGPPHMVVYNHFAPVGQFGQVGLSFMGTTYIPSGKQPDWKHNPTSSAMGISEGDVNTMNMISTQRNTPSMPAPIQHLAPGSPLLPMASPLAMFDMSPFQSSTDIPVQARWSHIPASPMHSVPISMPFQQQAEGVSSAQFSNGLSGDQTSTVNRFHDPSEPSDNNRNFPVGDDATGTQLSNELGPVDPASLSTMTTTRLSTSRAASNSLLGAKGNTQSPVTSNSSKCTLTNVGGSGAIHNSMSQSMTSAFKVQSSQQQTSSTPQYPHPTGYMDQRNGGNPQKVNSGGEWSHRRMGFQGRNQAGTDKNFASKMKQIYVAKPTSSGASGAV